MSRVIATVLQLKDQFTKPSQQILKSTKRVKITNNRTIASFRKMKTQIKDTAISAVKDIKNISVASAGIAAAMAVKTGLGEAMNLEGFKTQLLTATKDAKKAGEVMNYAVNLANSTPFETGSVVEASSKLEAMGLSARALLPDIADMAGATNKSLDQANEAIIDAQAGELERLKEFGITKQNIVDFASKNMRIKNLVNNKGQITDQTKFNKVLFKLMQSRFKGGADRQAKTFKGMWSTITGITKISLANIAGITNTGVIKQGSIYEQLKGKLQIVADVLLKWQKDGTIQKIADKSVVAVARIISIVKSIAIATASTIKFFSDNMGTIRPVVMIIVGAMLLYKGIVIAQLVYTRSLAIAEGIKTGVMATGAATVNIMTIAQWALNTAMRANPIGFVITVLSGLVIVGILVYKHFDKIKTTVLNLWGSFKNFIGGMSGFKLALAGPLAPILLLVKNFDKITSAGKKAWAVVKNFFGSGENKEQKQVKTYATGGIANKPSIFGEAGPEIAIPLKQNLRSQSLLNKASSIVTPKLNSNNKINNETTSLKSSSSNIDNKNNQSSSNQRPINITINGDIYGESDFKEKIAKALYEIINVNGSNVVV